MKKIVFLASLLCVALSMTAQTLTGTAVVAISSAHQGEKELTLIQSPAFSDAYDPTWDAEVQAEGGLYVIYGTTHYEIWASNVLKKNLPVGFGSCEDLTYTLKFSDFSGTAFTIYDRIADKVISVASSSNIQINGVDADPANRYEFTIDAADRNKAINDRFVINYDASVFVTSVTTNDYGWATFSYDQDLVPVNSAIQTLYKGAINGEYLDLDDVDYIPNGQGVLVKGAANTTYYFAAGSGNDVFDDNDLKATATYNTSMQNVYVLKGSAFLEYVGSNALAANKAYIQLTSAGPNNAPARISMRFNGTQDVENVETETIKTEKFVENGQIYIRRGNEVFNLQGQKVNF